jgi:hypothetical protein
METSGHERHETLTKESSYIPSSEPKKRGGDISVEIICGAVEINRDGCFLG